MRWRVTLVVFFKTTVADRSFVEVCKRSAAILKLWGDNVKTLGSLIDNEASRCPSFALGLGDTAMDLAGLDLTTRTNLVVLNEMKNKKFVSCYRMYERPLCNLDVTPDYAPSADCQRETLVDFLDLVSKGCPKGLGHKCPTFNKLTSMIYNEEAFCLQAALTPNSTLFREDQQLDCQALVRNYNACIVVGVKDLGMDPEVCVTTWKGYCSNDIRINVSDQSQCSSVVLPAILWTAVNLPHLQIPLEQGAYEEYCREVGASYLIWLTKRRSDATRKADTAEIVLRSGQNLASYLREEFWDENYKNVKSIVKLLQFADSLISSMEQQLTIMASRYLNEAKVAPLRTIEPEVKTLPVPLRFSFLFQRLTIPTAPPPPPPPPIFLDPSIYYVRLKPFFETYVRFQRMLDVAMGTGQDRLATLLPISYDALKRTDLQWLTDTSQRISMVIDLVQPDLISHLNSTLIAFNKERNNPLEYSEIIMNFIAPQVEPPEIEIVELPFADFDYRKDQFAQMRNLLRNSLNELRNGLMSWVKRYTDGDSVTKKSGKTFSSVEKLISTQINLMNQCYP